MPFFYEVLHDAIVVGYADSLKLGGSGEGLWMPNMGLLIHEYFILFILFSKKMYFCNKLMLDVS